jgi:hypothetical protein
MKLTLAIPLWWSPEEYDMANDVFRGGRVGFGCRVYIQRMQVQSISRGFWFGLQWFRYCRFPPFNEIPPRNP